MLQSVGRPHMAFRSIHVGGTNGKGSVAAMLARVLEASGQRVGLYTSPHLVDFGERITISGKPVEPAILEASAKRLEPFAKELEATFFEATTALAFLCFAKSEVDFVVAEVGLGGRLDSTNVLLPELAVITQVAWDHGDYLGGSLESIAREKAGIIKPGIPLVLGPLSPESARIMRRRARRAAAPVLELGVDAQVRNVQVAQDGTTLDYSGLRSRRATTISCPLLGQHQAENAGLAALAAEGLPSAWRPAAADIVAGIGETEWPGRMQIERRHGRLWVLDVAHNPAAMEALARTLASLELPGPLAAVIAILGDKPWREMLSPILASAERSIFTVAPSAPIDRRWDPHRVAASVSGGGVEVVEDLCGALERAAEVASTIVVTGSNHTVGDAMKHLGIGMGLLYSKSLR